MRKIITGIIFCCFAAIASTGGTKSYAISTSHVIAITSGSRAVAVQNALNAAEKEKLARDPIYLESCVAPQDGDKSPQCKAYMDIYGDAVRRHNIAVEEDNNNYRREHPIKYVLYYLGVGVSLGALLALTIILMGVCFA